MFSGGAINNHQVIIRLKINPLSVLKIMQCLWVCESVCVTDWKYSRKRLRHCIERPQIILVLVLCVHTEKSPQEVLLKEDIFASTIQCSSSFVKFNKQPNIKAGSCIICQIQKAKSHLLPAKSFPLCGDGKWATAFGFILAKVHWVSYFKIILK